MGKDQHGIRRGDKDFGQEWALIHFVENNGMAFGLSFGGSAGKLALSLFRLIAISFLIYYLNLLIKVRASTGLLISFAFILAGAVGNILDSAFYGIIFSDSPYHGGVAQLFPEAGGYAGFLHGKVVDMLYFPMFKGYFPEWFPFWAGRPYLFFKPVFNIADLSISTGVLNILFFQRGFFSGKSDIGQEEIANETSDEIPENSEIGDTSEEVKEEGGADPSTED